MPSNDPSRETDNITHVPLYGNFSHKEAHYLLYMKYVSSQDRILLLNSSPLFMAKGKKKCLNIPFSNPLRSCQNKEEEMKCARDDENGQLKLLNSHSILVLSARFFNFFPSIYTLRKFKNPIVSHYGLRLSPILHLRITVTTPSKHLLVLISVAYVIGVTGFS